MRMSNNEEVHVKKSYWVVFCQMPALNSVGPRSLLDLSHLHYLGHKITP